MATQLSEITRMHPMKISEAHERVKSLAWEPKYQPVLKYPTDYKLEATFAPTDLMKQVLRSYFPMQEEKDNRVFGTLDGALRGGMFRDVQPRWVEWMKFFLGFMPFPEISAARAMALLANAVPSNEIKNGLTFQMIDEVRHGTQQQALKKWYMENFIDPAGFDITEKAFGNCYASTIARQFGEGFIAGDAITAGNIFLQVVAETAFTNVLFVAMPSEAARNGDYSLPTVFLSTQSDESRHINNGFGILLMLLQHPENYQLLERDLRYSWWQNHRIVDAGIGVLIEYATKDRDKKKESYAELWKRWVFDDYYRTYLLPLEKYGLKIHHEDVEESWRQLTEKFYVHYVAQFFSDGWPFNFWRIDPLDERDYEWFEYKYPGWYSRFGKWWDHYRELSKPNGHAPITYTDVGYPYPDRCWNCLVPCLVREDMCIDEVDGQVYTYCSELCRWTHKEVFANNYQGRPTPAMGRFTGRREWESCYHGWDLADCLKDLGFVRADGKTLVPQPHTSYDLKDMWTLDHVRGLTVQSPLVAMRNRTPQERLAYVEQYRKGFTIK